jgi:acyl-CoA dehydrogenase
MSDYIAPVKEMKFVLNELAGLETICELPYFTDVSQDVIDPILEEAAKFSSGILAPLNRVGDTNGAVCVDDAVQETTGFADAYQQFCEGGWVALAANPEFGGMGLPNSIDIACGEMWTSANISFALCPMLGQGATSAIESHASDEIKTTFLEKMISGEWTGTMNLTEPQAGSDLAAVRAKAVPCHDHYLISGTKIFITWGDHQMTDNVVHLVLARTPDAPEGVKGISLFVVPKFLVNVDGSIGERNDVYAVSLEHKMGIHASPTCVMSFGEKQDGAVGYLVGEENKGLVYMFTMMNHARLNVGMQGIALSERAYQHAVAYAKDRVQGRAVGDTETGTIIRHPDVRRMLLMMKALTEASRAICYVTAAAFDIAHHGEGRAREDAVARGELLTPLAKGWSTEACQEVTSLGVQVHGGMGFIEETGAAQYMRDARIITIYEGTTGIQANDLIGRKLLRDNGAAFNQLLDDIRSTQLELEAADSGFASCASALREGIASLQAMAEWVVVSSDANPKLASAASVNFLMASGTVVGGWLLAKSALIAQGKISEDKQFYSAKILTARFYAEHVMPRTQALAQAAMSGSEVVLAMDDEQF